MTVFLNCSLIVLFLMLADSSNGQGTTCYFTFDTSSDDYKCDIRYQSFQNEESMIPVRGAHLPGYGDEDVTILTSFQSTIEVFPSPIIDKFINLRQIFLLSEMTTFNSSITNCQSLVDAWLSNNQFSSFVGGVFRNCLTLRTMHLHFSSIIDIDDNAFVGLVGLVNLTLSHNSITTLKQITFEPLSSLLTLDLENNQIEVLSPGIFGSSPLLETLKLGRNFISSWNPAILVSNTMLTTLDLSENILKAVDGNAFENLQNLETLIIGGRDFEDGLMEIPIFPNLTQLQTLNLNGNGIRHVSANSFQNLVNLKNLILTSNRIETVDFKMRPVKFLTKLERLSLWNNFIQGIQDNTFTMLEKLNDLDLGSNFIERLDARSIRPIVQMRRLTVEFNRIRVMQRALFDEVSVLQLRSIGNVCFNGEVIINNTIDNVDFENRVVPLLRQCFSFANSNKINLIILMVLFIVTMINNIC